MSETKKYSEEEIARLIQALNRDKSAYLWLKEIGCKELAALVDVILNANKSALEWLKKNENKVIYAFICALDNNREAFAFLLKSNTKEWAATISVFNGEHDAKSWLVKYELHHFISLADVLRDLYMRNYKSGHIATGLGGIGNGSGGAGGFGGFGGGDFGGGGAGGDW